MKKRVLVINEYSQLCTGFATYMGHILPLLHENPNIELAELGTYVNILHPKMFTTPWKVYPNEPDPRIKEQHEPYNRDKINQFGKWRFDEVCLDFKPDIVITIRDHWMDSWIAASPYRKYFKWISMPTVDGEPQKQEWIDTYLNIDRVITYSHWAKNVLEAQSGNKIKVFDVASPSVDTDVFNNNVPKSELRNQFGLQNDLFIVQTVMRNQPRKLFPDLMRAFAEYLSICKDNGRDDLAVKSFLYLHTTNPDLGWDIPAEIRKYKLSHKVILTYMCDGCGSVFPSFYNGDSTICRGCGTPKCRLPNTSIGVNRDQLALLMGCADLYIQYSVCEGWGMPPNDAKACGVPIMATDYSALSEQAHAPGGIAIPVERFFQETQHQTAQLRALPDNTFTANEIYKFACKTKEEQQAMGQDGRNFVLDHYTHDKIAAVWANAIATLDVPDQKDTWYSPAKLWTPKLQLPNGLDNMQFVKWCYNNILNQEMNGMQAQHFVTILNQGFEQSNDEEGKIIRNPVDRNKILEFFINQIKHNNMLESLRFDKVNNVVKPKPAFNVTQL